MYVLFSMNQSEDVQITAMSGSGFTLKQYLHWLAYKSSNKLFCLKVCSKTGFAENERR